MPKRTRSTRGTTLIEAMIAMLVVTVGGVGALAIYKVQLGMNADARRITEATALARDLVEGMALWPYDDARLSNDVPENDTDIADTTQAFEDAAVPVADHGEADLTKGSATWTGLPSRDGFERYWNVSPDASGRAIRIAAIVRWQHGSGWRRVVALTSRASTTGMGP